MEEVMFDTLVTRFLAIQGIGDFLIIALVAVLFAGAGFYLGSLFSKKNIEKQIGNVKEAARKTEEAAKEDAKKVLYEAKTQKKEIIL